MAIQIWMEILSSIILMDILVSPPYKMTQADDVAGMTGVYSHDEALANAKVGIKSTPEGYVWHHVEDGKTMQLIPQDIHQHFPHTGGASGLRNGTLP